MSRRGPTASDEADPAEVIAGRAAIVPFGGEQAHKGFALALLVELLARSIAPVEGDAALVLMARPASAPALALREALRGLRFPGDAGPRRRAEAERVGAVELDADLWRWLSST